MLGVTVANSIITVNLNVDQSRVYLGNTSIPYDPEHTDATIDLNATATDFHYVRVIVFLYDETDQKIFDGLIPPAGHVLSIRWSYVVLPSREPTLTRGVWSRIIGFVRVDHMQRTYESFVQWWKGRRHVCRRENRMIDLSGQVTFDPPLLSSNEYGYQEAVAYSQAQAPMLTREPEILKFIMLLNLKAGVYYDWPWMPDEWKKQVHEWNEELKQLEAEGVPHSMALAIIRKKMTARRL